MRLQSHVCSYRGAGTDAGTPSFNLDTREVEVVDPVATILAFYAGDATVPA